MRLTLFLVLLLLVALMVRLVWIQGIDPANAAAAALKARTTSQVLEPVRGDILGADGTVLATSIVRYDLVVDQRQVKAQYPRRSEDGKTRVTATAAEDVDKLADVLGLDRAAVETAVFGEAGKPKKGYSVITKGITPEAKDKAEAVGFPYLQAIQTSERSYPNGKLAGPVLGFLKNDVVTGDSGSSKEVSSGAEGLELSQNAELSGKEGERVYEKGADGVRIPSAPLTETPAVDGKDVKLTIDPDIQWKAQEEVMAQKKRFGAEWVNAVVMEVKTGRILALADSTSMDPNDPGATEAKYRTSTTVTQAYEPGSTGKLATFSLALQKGVITPTSEFTVPNAYKIDHETINDSLPHATYEMTAAGILARSYNAGTVQVGNKLSDRERYDFMKKLGLGTQTDIGLDGVNPGILVPPEQWERRQRLTTMFGQGYTATTLQTASILQTIGNDGVRIAPQLIDSYIDPDGTSQAVAPASSQRVMSSKVSAEMRRMMEGVVTAGTSTKMAIDGYRVGGKSGTAQAVGAGGGLTEHTSSFAGMVPIENPQYLVVVVMQHPSGDWQNWSEAIPFKEIMKSVLAKYSVAPDTTKPNPYRLFVGKNQKYAW